MRERISFSRSADAPVIAPDAVVLYVGTVMHARLKPFHHRFSYSVFNILIDIERLREAGQKSWLFGVNRWGVTSFFERDHRSKPIAETMGSLSGDIRELLREHGCARAPDRILLLCYPRVFGYVFNPISIYFCLAGDVPIAMVYEVRNTFGGRHVYVEPVEAEQATAAGLRQKSDKRLHVSPFIDMNMRYHFHTTMPHQSLAFRILETDESGPLLSATLKAERHALTSLNLSKLLIIRPFLTLKVITTIHFEALRLWLKGAKYRPNPHRRN